MKHIHPEILQAGDIVITTEFRPFSCISRRKTWGDVSIFNMTLGTHCFPIADRGDRIYYACEMLLGGGPEMTELPKYDHGPRSWFNHIVKVYRHGKFMNGADSWVMRDKANDYMLKVHSVKVKYGVDEIFKYIGWSKKPDNPYTMICSEWCRNLFAHAGIEMPFPPDKIVTPADWQRWGQSGGMTEINPYK